MAYLAVLNVGSAMLSDIITGLALPFSSSKPIEASLMDATGDDDEVASACGLNSQNTSFIYGLLRTYCSS